MKLLYKILFLIALVFYFSNEIYHATSKNTSIAVGLLIIFSGFLLFYLVQIFRRKSEITLSKEGIDLRYNGFYHWSHIKRFKLREYKYYRSHGQYLIIQFKEIPEVEISISEFEINSNEVVENILLFKGSSEIYYDGLETK